MAVAVFFVRISNGQIISSSDTVASNESLRVVLGAGKPNYSYKLRRNGVNLQDITTDSTGQGSLIFIPGVAAGTYSYDVMDIPAQEAAGVTSIVVTGGTGGGTGGISKTVLIVGALVVGFFMLGGKRIKW